MTGWLHVDLLFAVLLVTTYTFVGLVALWVNRSSPHWFLRTTILLLVLAAPLVIPACEPFIVFWLQTAVIIAGVVAWRRWGGSSWNEIFELDRAKVASNSRLPTRFSLATLMLWIPIVAILTVIFARFAREITSQNLESITTLALNSFASGCAVLLGAMLFASQRKWIATLAATVLALLISATMARFDWLFASFVRHGGWPPQKSTAGWQFLYETEWLTGLAWFAVIPAIAISTWLFSWLWFVAVGPAHVAAARGRNRDRTRATQRVFAGAVFSVLLLLFALPPALLAWRLSHPLPLPSIAAPKENGFDEVVRAGRAFNTSPILSTNVEPKSTAELSAEIAKFREAYQLLENGLSRNIRARKWPEDGKLPANFDVSLTVIQDVRAAARGIMRKAELAQQEKRYHDAAKAAIENVRLGGEVARDGVLIEFLVGVAIEGIGDDDLNDTIPHLSADECRNVVATLSDHDRNREPIEEVLSRDRVWSDHGFGWTGRFVVLLHELAGTGDSFGYALPTLRRRQAVSRLLMVEAALRAFTLEQGSLPDSLQQMIPSILPEMPIDPFDPSGEPIRYVRTNDGYVLYSIGADGKDDGGRPPVPDENELTDFDGDGDFRIDVMFAEYNRIDEAIKSLPEEPAVEDDLAEEVQISD